MKGEEIESRIVSSVNVSMTGSAGDARGSDVSSGEIICEAGSWEVTEL